MGVQTVSLIDQKAEWTEEGSTWTANYSGHSLTEHLWETNLTNPISWFGKHDVSYFNFQRRLNTFFSTAPHLVIQMKTATPKTSTEWHVRPREPWQQSSGKPAAIEPPVVICCLSVFKYTVCTPLLRFMQEHFHTLNLNFQKWGFT